MKKKRGKSQKKIQTKSVTHYNSNGVSFDVEGLMEANKKGPEEVKKFLLNMKIIDCGLDNSTKIKAEEGVFFYSVSRKDGVPICMGKTHSKNVVFLATYSVVVNICGPNYTGQPIDNLNIVKIPSAKEGTYVDSSVGYDGRYIRPQGKNTNHKKKQKTILIS